MTTGAQLPPAGLPGLDPAWSRLVRTTDQAGAVRSWHVLDTGPPSSTGAGSHGTVLCVHGNPTWSYLWRGLVAQPPSGWRVVAPDHLGMGWSERSTEPRTLADRVADLSALTAELGLDSGPVVVVAHDWGGPIGLGWALDHLDQVAGVVLTNTAVDQPAAAAPPIEIRLARSPIVRDLVCVRTPIFVRAATAVSSPAGGRRISRDVRDAYAAPYGSAARRQAVGDFVADIPLEGDHPSTERLAAIRDGLGALAGTPALLVWGPRDPVFSDRYLHDLEERLPHAAVQRYESASHLVTEGAPSAIGTIRTWIGDLHAHQAAAEDVRAGSPTVAPLWSALAARAGENATAVVELGMGQGATSFADLDDRVTKLAAGLAAYGVRRGQRVGLLIPPGPDLIAVVFACWRAGAVVVVADAGLGLRRLAKALRSADPAFVLGAEPGLAVARALRIPGRRILLPVRGASSVRERLTGAEVTTIELERRGETSPDPAAPGPDDEAAVLFTSGATGPPKGVVYRHGQARAQLEIIRQTYAITPGDRLVAAFAPFVLYGPLLGIASAIPRVDVTRPATLTATALADAVAAIDATLVFASPGALRNVVRTADGLPADAQRALAGVRLVLSAGAPVPLELLESVQRVFPSAELHTPYGMTEALPITTISRTEIIAAGPGNGVCVGPPLRGVEVMISALDSEGRPTGSLSVEPEITGEICVRADHVKDRYDRLWAVERQSARHRGWHATSDVGHLDQDGRLWVEGRLAHVIVTSGGVVTPVGVEQRIEALPRVQAAAVVGVGPRGTQQVVAVIIPSGPAAHDRSAGLGLTQEVRAVAGVPVSTVLVTSRLPVDIRHQSKIDRERVAAWAGRLLAGERAGRRP